MQHLITIVVLILIGNVAFFYQEKSKNFKSSKSLLTVETIVNKELPQSEKLPYYKPTALFIKRI